MSSLSGRQYGNDEDYWARFNRACIAGGAGGLDWNIRFRNGLRAEGLMLETYDGAQLVAEGPMMAPRPCGDVDGWPESLIVYRNDG